jgi:TolB-like protein
MMTIHTATDDKDVLSMRLRKPTAVATLIIAALVLISSVLYLRRPTHAHVPQVPRRLAILPFENMRPDPDSDFLGFSLADAVITKLGYVSGLNVRPSYSVQKYRTQISDIQKIAAELNVDTLLVGNFIRDGNDLRITYQLIDVKGEKILDRDTIDLRYDKLLTVQDAVAQQIVKGLALNLSPAEVEQLKPYQSIHPPAYEYYLRGVDLYSRNDFAMAVMLLEKSAELDPKYALTWAQLGRAYTASASFAFGGREQYRKAQASYERALSLQPTQIEAHIYMANLLTDTGRVEQAVPLLREALRTNPNQAEVHWELGYAYRFAGMSEESLAECEHARQLDPTVKLNSSALNAYLYLKQYDKFMQSLPRNSDSAFILFYRGYGQYYQKNWEQAARDFDAAYELDPLLFQSQMAKAFGASIAHQETKGLKVLRQTEDKIEARGVGDPEAIYKIAQAYAVLGDKVSALRVLRLSIENGFFPYPYFMADPLLDNLRSEGEFTQIMDEAERRHESFKTRFFSSTNT